MKKIKFYFNKKSAKNMLSVFSKHKCLLILIFFSVFSAFVFNVIYKYAYFNINFIEYKESYESRVILSIRNSKQMFMKISENIEERNKKFESEKNMEYNNPFEFGILNFPQSGKTSNFNDDVKSGLMLPLSDEIGSNPNSKDN